MFGDAAVASVASDAVAVLEQQPRYDVIFKVNAAQERAAACHFLSQQLPSGTSHLQFVVCSKSISTAVDGRASDFPTVRVLASWVATVREGVRVSQSVHDKT